VVISLPGQTDELNLLKNQFLVSLNHEIRTPLTGIIGMTDLLLETPLDEEQRSYVDMGRMCAKSLLATLDSTLELSTITAGTLQLEQIEFALPETLKAAVGSYQGAAEAKGLRMTCWLDPELPAVAVGDSLRLQRLLIHLLDNALKFTHQGGIEVQASGRHKDNGTFHLHCQVRDTGVGIAEDKLDSIFESFTQLDAGFARSYSGLGLGLAIARKLAQMMGGDITVDSKPGVGSLFSVLVPLALPVEPVAGSSFAYRDPSLPSSAKWRILVVEDNPVGQTVVKHMLERAGYQVACAGSGAAALQQVSDGVYDLILMDLHMPDLDGLETTRRIRTLPGCARTPILALTADVTDHVRQLCEQSGLDAFIPKPVQADELLSTLALFLS
jgi:CheY-like chemotaxis protein